MIVLVLSSLVGLIIGLSRPTTARLIFLGWFALIAIVVGPMLLMPDARGILYQGSAALTLLGLPICLALGWIVGLLIARLRRRTT